MRIARLDEGPGIWAGWDGERWRVLADDPYRSFAAGSEPVLGDVSFPASAALLAPCEPLVVAGIAQNGPDAPLPVQAWLKSPRSVVASGLEVALRREAGRQVAEAEIAVVIGRTAIDVAEEDAASVILGVTAVNDLSSPDRAELDVRNFESKGGTGYTPLGPWIETDADLASLPYALVVDGETVASTDASELPASIAACVAYVSRWVPLGPGDVIMTGAPRSSAEVRPGQTVEVRVGDMTLVTPTR